MSICKVPRRWWPIYPLNPGGGDLPTSQEVTYLAPKGELPAFIPWVDFLTSHPLGVIDLCRKVPTYHHHIPVSYMVKHAG